MPRFLGIQGRGGRKVVELVAPSSPSISLLPTRLAEPSTPCIRSGDGDDEEEDDDDLNLMLQGLWCCF